MAPEGNVPAPRPFACAGTTITGGGVYVLEVTRGTRSERIAIDFAIAFADDGCKVRGSITIRFETNRVCTSQCGPTGELLNVAHTCSSAVPNLSNLPSCAEPAM